MNNEIKEIIESMKEWSVDGNLYFEINDEKAKLLYDYITNLQEENEHIKVNNKETLDSFDETMKDIKENLIARIQRQECEIHNLKAKLEMYENGVYFSSKNDKLQEKIDKAIECINYYAIENSDYEKIYNIEEETLLNILGGKDE